MLFEKLQRIYRRVDEISGTPTTAGISNFIVKATNSAGNATKALSIKIEDGVGVAESEMSGIAVYPNPTTGELIIENGELKINSVEVFDVYGKKLQSKIVNLKSTIELDISHLPTGMYFLRITTERGVLTKKVLKE